MPINIPILSSPVNATFNFIDVAEGYGIVKLYGATHNTNGTKTYFLTTGQPYSNDIETSGGSSISNDDWNSVLTNNFDVTFNSAQYIKGNAYLNYSIGSRQGGSGSTTVKMLVSGCVLSNNTQGSTWATVSGTFFSHGDSAGIQSQTQCIRFDLSSGYTLNAGDVLRLTFPLWCVRSGASAYLTPGYGHDPQDRDAPSSVSGAHSSKFELYLPLKIK
ncbi:MAG: hypothetical protein HY427_03675 [Candidatus Levybacteria bacterium]|nr:hypothetical protein [Candidatus Levybacteria bacterium]